MSTVTCDQFLSHAHLAFWRRYRRAEKAGESLPTIPDEWAYIEDKTGGKWVIANTYSELLYAQRCRIRRNGGIWLVMTEPSEYTRALVECIQAYRVKYAPAP